MTARREPRDEPAPGAEAFLPAKRTLATLREAARTCRGCPLYSIGTQTVFGAGRAGARIVLVGEQPGNDEDLAGEPFVGPAGRVLDEALVAAGIERGDAYVTNAVKHFKWEPRGKRRLHKKPSVREARACRPWLDAELAVVEPHVLVLLGNTAGQSLLGAGFRVGVSRGRRLESDLAPHVIATVHPSFVLRQRTDADRAREMELFVRDLAVAAKLARE